VTATSRAITLATMLLWLGGAAAVAQLLLPWQLDTSNLGSTTYTGSRYLRADAVAVFGAIVLALLFRWRGRSRPRDTSRRLLACALAMLAAAAFGAYLFVTDLNEAASSADSMASTLLDTVGPGQYVAVLGGLLTTIGALLDLRPGEAEPKHVEMTANGPATWG
jgi:hypothetical protein